ncbi:hypothetical protein [Cryobacterium zhongshanensis]|uniref:Uncharacterized protein n=1 Tax=Cryobacterium zhongshanensis TaxID=2928153 RepID=A0AA41UIN4_9MICO|nr:hypothetical protein [Cryobacterium zhongshanensis]MCI4659724.1 hypothetical protein [Cryobacterium zhongshanensis]
MKKRTGWIITGSIVGALAVAIAIPVVLDFQIEKTMYAIADRFVPEPGWTLGGESASDHYQCSGMTGPCDSFGRFYHVDVPLSRDELATKISAAGWVGKVSGGCEPQPEAQSQVLLCTAEGVTDGYRFTVQLTESVGAEILNVRLNKIP